MPVVKPDLSEFESISNAQPVTCVIARSIACLEPQDRTNFEAALGARDPGGWKYGHNTLATFLGRRGLDGKDQAVKKHRDGDCCCGR